MMGVDHPRHHEMAGGPDFGGSGMPSLQLRIRPDLEDQTVPLEECPVFDQANGVGWIGLLEKVTPPD